MGYAIDRHVIETDLEAGRDYRFDTRPAGLNGCDAWLAEGKDCDPEVTGLQRR
jgi:hypothetical protein